VHERVVALDAVEDEFVDVEAHVGAQSHSRNPRSVRGRSSFAHSRTAARAT
jgi:hypothetical protein